MSLKQANLNIVDVSEIPVYPIPGDERLESHYFIAFHFNRWLNSDFRLKATAEVRAYALDLFCIAQNQSPVGTLPDDEELLAKLLMIDLAQWRDLCKRDMPPLYNWSKCLVGNVTRLAHPVVTEMAVKALSSKSKSEKAKERERERKRHIALRFQIVEAGGSSRLAENKAYIERLDAWLVANCTGNRTPSRVREAMEALDSEVS